jgi:hypothetical protein
VELLLGRCRWPAMGKGAGCGASKHQNSDDGFESGRATARTSTTVPVSQVPSCSPRLPHPHTHCFFTRSSDLSLSRHSRRVAKGYIGLCECVYWTQFSSFLKQGHVTQEDWLFAPPPLTPPSLTNHVPSPAAFVWVRTGEAQWVFGGARRVTVDFFNCFIAGQETVQL